MVTEKLVESAPAGIVIGNPTFAAAVLEPRVIVAPPAGALPVSVTVPFTVPPPTRLDEVTVTFAGTGGVIVRSNAASVPS